MSLTVAFLLSTFSITGLTGAETFFTAALTGDFVAFLGAAFAVFLGAALAVFFAVAIVIILIKVKITIN